MATEPPESPELTKKSKKHKKDKRDIGHETKKRKRDTQQDEDGIAAANPQGNEGGLKKQKKSKDVIDRSVKKRHHREQDDKSEDIVPDSQAQEGRSEGQKEGDGVTVKPKKKRRRNGAEEAKEDVVPEAETNDDAITKVEADNKRRKKKKRRRDETQEANVDASPDGQTNGDMNQKDEGEGKKPKKKRRRDSREGTIEVDSGAQADEVAPEEQEKNEGDNEKPKKKKKKQWRDELHDEQEVVVPDSQDKERSLENQKAHEAETVSRSLSQAQMQFLAKNSPFVRKTSSLYLPLSPCAYNFPIEGLCAEHVSPLLMSYQPTLGGVVMAYENPRISENPSDAVQVKLSEKLHTVLALSNNEYAVSFVWLTAEFLLFRPRRGTWMFGDINLQNESFLGLVCYNYFNASIEREKLPKDWRWVEEGEKQQDEGADGEGNEDVEEPELEETGHFVDGQGKRIDGRVVFRVDDFEPGPAMEGSGGSVMVLGTLLPERDET